MGSENTARNLNDEEKFPEVVPYSPEKLESEGFVLLDSFDNDDRIGRNRVFHTMDNLRFAGYDVHFVQRKNKVEIWAKDSLQGSKPANKPGEITVKVSHLVNRIYRGMSKSKRKGGKPN
jgi:hypothetical protein